MLANNTFTGAMPDSWSSPATFTHLQALDLSHNSLSGQLPAAWAAPGAFPNLTSLLLSDNSLQGSLPTEWGQAAALQNLSLLTLQNNQLSGGVPAAWQLTKQVGTAFLGRGQSSYRLPAIVACLAQTTPAAVPQQDRVDSCTSDAVATLLKIWTILSAVHYVMAAGSSKGAAARQHRHVRTCAGQAAGLPGCHVTGSQHQHYQQPCADWMPGGWLQLAEHDIRAECQRAWGV